MTRPPPLRRADRGETVRDLQERLTAAGHRVRVTSTYDLATEDAVRAFQAERGLRIDGVCGPETWGALIESAFHLGERLLSSRRPMMRGDDVGELQRGLNALGFDAGREDAIFGHETEDALRQFQRNAGLAADGVCGPATLAALARLGTLAAGDVAAVRERDDLRRGDRKVASLRLFLAADPEFAALADTVARGFRGVGTKVVLDTSGADHSALAVAANRFEADVFCAFVSGVDPGARCAYFASKTFRSEGGYCLARRLTDALAGVLDRVDEPVGRTFRLLRETRMAAVVCELPASDDLLGPRRLEPHAELARVIVEGVRRGVEEPPDLDA